MLNNALLDEATLNASANSFTRIAGTAIQTGGDGLGKPKPDAQPGNGLGGAGTLEWHTRMHYVWMAVFAFMLTL